MSDQFGSCPVCNEDGHDVALDCEYRCGNCNNAFEPDEAVYDGETMKARIARLAAHVLAENQARVGYPYENRTIEMRHAIENLPDRVEFDAVLAAVKKDWKRCTARTLAELLTGVAFCDNCVGIEGFGTGQYDAQLSEWGLSTRPVPKPALTSADLEIYDGTWEHGSDKRGH